MSECVTFDRATPSMLPARMDDYVPDGIDIPEELNSRCERLEALSAAKRELERRAESQGGHVQDVQGARHDGLAAFVGL